MHLILSPAKNLNETDNVPEFITHTTTPALLDDSAQLAQSLKQLDVIDIQELMSVSAKIAQMNVERNARWQIPFDNTAKAAIYLFDGDAYKGLDAYELSADEINYLNRHLAILSGLYGLLRPLDTIMPYRLEMGTKLRVGEYKDLYEFWGNSITDLLNERMHAQHSTTLINLASNEYFKAVKTNKVNATIITPKFLDKKEDGYKMISFYAKRARGLMVRFCAVNNITNPKDLQGFDMENYYFSAKDSTDTDWVFLRDEPI